MSPESTSSSQGGRSTPVAPIATPRAKYDLAPLAAAAGIPLPSLGRHLGMSGRTWQIARDQGVGEKAADRYAVRLGLHPASVWPEMLDIAVQDAEAAAEAALARQRERWAADYRKRYHSDPEFRARRAEYEREYKANARGYIAAQKRAWNKANRERIRERKRLAMQRYRARLREREAA